MAKFDFITALQHEINIINRAKSLRILEDDELDLLADYEFYLIGMFPLSELKSKYMNRYSNVR